MRLYYSIVDPYPAYRSDLAELFGVELKKLGLQTEWYMASGPGVPLPTLAYRHQKVNLPAARFSAASLLGRLSYWATDLMLMIRQVIRPADAIQCRDKYLASLLAVVVSAWRACLSSIGALTPSLNTTNWQPRPGRGGDAGSGKPKPPFVSFCCTKWCAVLPTMYLCKASA